MFFVLKKKKKSFFFFFTNNVFLLQISYFPQKALCAPDDYIVYDGTIFCFVYSVHVNTSFEPVYAPHRAISSLMDNSSLLQITP